MTRRWAAPILLSVGLLGASAPASARVDASTGYTKAQTYSGALRYVRVDLGYEVVERDPDAAYLIFKYAAPGGSKAAAVTGTLEVVEADGGVRVFVSLPRMPEYHERVLRDGLLKKLREEYGAPPAPAKKPQKAPVRAEGEAPPDASKP
jgi:hypothetical protein